MSSDLQIIHEVIDTGIKNWRKRSPAVPKGPPWPSDSPCYYCTLDESPKLKESQINPCDYCIHNNNAKLFKDSKDEHDQA